MNVSAGTSLNDYRLITWSPPCSGTVKLNTEDSSKGNPGAAGADGIFRDFSGRWLLEFHVHLGVCTSVVVELEAI